MGGHVKPALIRASQPRRTAWLQSKQLVRTAGLEPARGYPRQIFLPTTVFTADDRAAEAAGPVCSLDYPFIIASTLTLDAARLVSTPSGPSPGLARDWHRPGTDP